MTVTDSERRFLTLLARHAGRPEPTATSDAELLAVLRAEVEACRRVCDLSQQAITGQRGLLDVLRGQISDQQRLIEAQRTALDAWNLAFSRTESSC